ncbi:MAG: four helix bundle protein [Planctomycetes bacterium]|nr:four helix bundle protein [Planctomycetota bacterium]MCK5473613.1 four helix bundle protein [Planctomycetota bacterium]
MQNQNSKPKTELKYRAYQYSIKVIEFLDTLPRDFSTRVIAKQLLRSATSIGANIVEAKGASSKRDFTNFFSYSLKSANESLYWLGLLRDAKKINNTQIEYLLNETKELANILGSSILTLKGKNKF